MPCHKNNLREAERCHQVVLEDLTIDLEVCAVVRIPCAEEMTETIVLQRQTCSDRDLVGVVEQ